MNALMTNFNDQQFPPQQPTSQAQQSASQMQQDFGGRPGDSTGLTHTPDRSILTQGSDLDRWGLQGLLETIRHDNPDVSGLARGQELTSLGLNLNSSE